MAGFGGRIKAGLSLRGRRGPHASGGGALGLRASRRPTIKASDAAP